MHTTFPLLSLLLPTLITAIPNGAAKHAAHKHLHKHSKQQHQSVRVAEAYVGKEPRDQQSGEQSTNWGPNGGEENDYVVLSKKHHDYHRSNHGCDFVEWDWDLAYEAQQIANSCVYAHNQQLDTQAGQNIAAGYDASRIGDIITNLWYNNEQAAFAPNYGRANPDMTLFEQWGHLTQICWCATTRIGCATSYCPGGLANVFGDVEPYFTVCQYKEAGNVDGEYAVNVKPPQGAPQINGQTPLEYTN